MQSNLSMTYDQFYSKALGYNVYDFCNGVLGKPQKYPKEKASYEAGVRVKNILSAGLAEKYATQLIGEHKMRLTGKQT